MTSDHPNKRTLPHESDHERAVRHRLANLLDSTSIPPEELIDNLALSLRRQPLTDLLSQDALYRMILDVPGTIMEFGVHRGRHLAALTALRGVYEPYNPHRRRHLHRVPRRDRHRHDEPQRGPGSVRARRDLPSPSARGTRRTRTGRTPRSLPADLDRPRRRADTVPRYLADNPHTIIALAYFDLDLYEPTRDMIEAIRPYLTQGSVLAFDELAHAKWPGETVALRDTLGTDFGRLLSLPGRATPVYLRWGM